MGLEAVATPTYLKRDINKVMLHYFAPRVKVSFHRFTLRARVGGRSNNHTNHTLTREATGLLYLHYSVNGGKPSQKVTDKAGKVGYRYRKSQCFGGQTSQNVRKVQCFGGQTSQNVTGNTGKCRCFGGQHLNK